MTRTRKRKPTIGTVSHATLRAKDLIPAFADELRAITGALPHNLYDRIRGLRGDYSTDDAAEIVNELTDALNTHALPYSYFGAHEGDSSDFGFWLSHDALEDFDGLKVADTSEVPKDYSGEVLHVNERGNTTLYAARRGTLTEVWAIV